MLITLEGMGKGVILTWFMERGGALYPPPLSISVNIYYKSLHETHNKSRSPETSGKLTKYYILMIFIKIKLFFLFPRIKVIQILRKIILFVTRFGKLKINFGQLRLISSQNVNVCFSRLVTCTQ